jgi:hypothetical protein
MSQRILFGAVALLGLCHLAAAAGESYRLDVRTNLEPGESVVVRRVTDEATEVTVKDASGKVVDKKAGTERKEESYTETGVVKGDMRPGKFKRVYTKAERAEGKGESKARSYQGKTVLFEERAGKYEVSVDGKDELAAADRKQLASAANEGEGQISRLLLPDREVKEGEAWKIDGKTLAKVRAFGKVDAGRSDGEGKLLRVYRKDGHLFGVIEYRLKLAPSAQKGLKIGLAELAITLEAAIDGSLGESKMTAKGRVTASRQVESKGKKYDIEAASDVTSTVERTPAKKKD